MYIYVCKNMYVTYFLKNSHIIPLDFISFFKHFFNSYLPYLLFFVFPYYTHI